MHHVQHGEARFVKLGKVEAIGDDGESRIG
jgi:hypothetical protein